MNKNQYNYREAFNDTRISLEEVGTFVGYTKDFDLPVAALYFGDMSLHELGGEAQCGGVSVDIWQ